MMDEMLRWLALVACTAACGRVSFTSTAGDAGDADAAREESDAAADAVVDPSLLVSFDFGGPDPLRDGSSFGHHGTCTTCPTYEPGRDGLAARFTGSGCIVIADTPALRPALFTVAAWIRPRIDAHMSFVSRALNPATAFTDSFELWRESTGVWRAAVDPRGLTGTGTPPDVWHHFATTYDGATIALYQDGALVDSVAATTSPYSDADVRIGCDVNIGVVESFADGWIDDVRINDRALSAAEIAALAQ